MKWIDYIVKYFLGILFIFSGLVKLNDPIGTSIKLKEYFEVFSHDFSPIFRIFAPISLWIAVFVIILEIILGIALLIHYRIRLTAWLFLLLIVFFTFLTFYSAWFNKVTDCGCFGDVIPLTPWQSFLKDVVFLSFVIVLFIRKENFKPFIVKSFYADGLILMCTLLNVVIAIYAINHLPYIDFLPYKTGNNIPSLMKPSAPYEYRYIMEKNGNTYSFKNIPADTSYQFRDMQIMNPEVMPKITDYHIWLEDIDYTDSSFTGNRLMIIIYDVTRASSKNIDKLRQLIQETENRVSVSILTSSNEDEIDEFRHEHQLPVPFYFSDMTVLETMVRSNPGLVLLQDGTVMGKWHYNDMPSGQEVLHLLN